MPSNSPNEGTPSFLSPATLIGLVFKGKLPLLINLLNPIETKVAYHLALRIEQE
jgi:hypothetical protein